MKNRQVHLDFHTSPDIRNIGKNFSKENFQKALKVGNVDSITVFAKCHHGLCYYPTKVGTMHPHLDFDLTGAMVEAAHEIGVKAPVYITAGWSEGDSLKHPEWVSRKKNGEFYSVHNYDLFSVTDEPREHCSWHSLCLNDGEYAEHIYAITEEVCQRYKKLDGLFFDICVVARPCYCESCRKGMKLIGLDPENDDDVFAYYELKHTAFMKKCSDILRKYHPDATIFFNTGGADQYKPEYHPYQTHYEMEDLPTAWGGYDKLPPRAKYFERYGKHCVGMTGKFHLDWGEFGGFKPKEALKYEIATMATYGVGASIGDHLHPDGEMEMETYRNIGYAYDYLEKIAPFCFNGESIADIGIYFSDDTLFDEGITNILLQKQIDYKYILDNDFKNYKVVIFPEKVVLDDKVLTALNEYIENNGKVILMADALVTDGKFQIDTGLLYIGEPEYDCDYIFTNSDYTDVPDAPMLCDVPGHRTKAIDAQVKAEFITPYFNRTHKHFCGHKNTPHNKQSVCYPAIAKKGNIIYLSHSMPVQYRKFGSIYHRNYFINALNEVYCDRIMNIEGLGSLGRQTLIRQSDKQRYCLNMTYACPTRRGAAEIIEDIPTMYDIRVTLNVKENIKNVYIALSGQKLDFKNDNEKITFTVPELNCHTSIVIEY